MATSPLVSALLGRIFLKDRVAPVTWVAIGIAVCGIGLMVGDGLATGQFWGNVFGFVAGAMGFWFAGLYQVAIQVPASLADGDWPIRASIGSFQSPDNVMLSVKR